MPCLFGVVTAFFVPPPVSLGMSFARPEQFDWEVYNQIKRVAHSDESDSGEERQILFTPERQADMKRMSRWAVFWAIFTILGHWLLWPIAMYGAKMVFSKPFFTAWMVISFIYLWFTLVVRNFYPLWDGGAKNIWKIFRGIAVGDKAPAIGAESSGVDSLGEETKAVNVKTKTMRA